VARPTWPVTFSLSPQGMPLLEVFGRDRIGSIDRKQRAGARAIFSAMILHLPEDADSICA
jgi:hypothetical protein